MTGLRLTRAIAADHRLRLVAWISAHGPATLDELGREWPGVSRDAFANALQYLLREGWLISGLRTSAAYRVDALAAAHFHTFVVMHDPLGEPVAQGGFSSELALRELRVLRQATTRQALLTAIVRGRVTHPRELGMPIVSMAHTAWSTLKKDGWLTEAGELTPARPSHVRRLALDLEAGAAA